MQMAGRTSLAMGPLKTPYENSCTCTRNFESSTIVINFPLRLGNNFANLNTPHTENKTCSSKQLPQGNGELYAAGLQEIKKTITTAQLSFFFQAKLL